MSEQTRNQTEAEEILSEFENSKISKNVNESDPSIVSEVVTPTEIPVDNTDSESARESSVEPKRPSNDKNEQTRNVIFVGAKPILTYVTATLTQLSTEHIVTIKARGKRITQAVDVSQMIVKRMNTVGYFISDVRITSDSLQSQDGKERNVSTIEIDVTTK